MLPVQVVNDRIPKSSRSYNPVSLKEVQNQLVCPLHVLINNPLFYSIFKIFFSLPKTHRKIIAKLKMLCQQYRNEIANLKKNANRLVFGRWENFS